MKKSSILFIITILTLGLITGVYYSSQINPKSLATDSGFDSSWDGGSDSSWSSSSSSDHDYGRSGKSGSGSGDVNFEPIDFSDPLTWTLIGCFTGFTVVIILIWYIQERFKKFVSGELDKKRLLKKRQLYKEDINLIESYGYKVGMLVNICYDIYVKVQKAWASNDIDAAKNYLTNDLYNMYKGQIAVLKAKKQRNEMSHFAFCDGFVCHVEEKFNTLTIKVIMNVRCRDYLIDEKTLKVIRGNASKNNDYIYIMDFVVSKKELIDKCPNCNANLKEGEVTSICEYCGSTIVRDTNKIVLARKEMLLQK